MKEKVVLAYSGGLDTTAIIPWLKENYDYEVICCCVDCGQGEELDGLDERAKLSGATKLYIEDITDEFCDDYIVPCVQADAVYENKYLLGTSMAHEKKMLLLSATVQPVREMTRFVSSFLSKHLLLILKLLLLGVMTNGKWIPVNPKLNTAKHMAFIFHSLLTRATAVTVTYGTSATKVLS
mgnify:CR=1 FL=1